MSESRSLEGKVIIVSGVLKGAIGGATVRQVAQAGADVVVVDYQQAIVDEAVATVEALGGRCHGLVADLIDPAQSQTIVTRAVEHLGRVDGIANIAGGTLGLEQPLEDTSIESFRRTMAINLEYAFLICRDAARWMIANGAGGSLVNIGSISAITAAPDHGPYGAAKSGVAALSRTMAFEWGRHGIRANTVSPGAVLTERHAAGMKSAPGDGGVVWTSVDELAAMVLFLLSDASSGVSGQTIVVDSGLSTKFCGGQRPLIVNKAVPVA